MQLKMYNINKDRVVKGEIEIGRSKGSSVVGLAGHDQEWRVEVEVHGRELGVEGDVLIACG